MGSDTYLMLDLMCVRVACFSRTVKSTVEYCTSRLIESPNEHSTEDGMYKIKF